MYTIEGHHHISMITKDIHKNNFFYQKILGLRRVKVSVNQDDPTMYHLFFGDKIGSPGTGLTFFEMPRAGRTYEGTNAYTRIGLVVSSVDRLTYWKDRFAHFQISHEKLTTYANRPALPFKDPDGLPLMLIASEDQPSSYIRWEDSPIPKEHQIRGMGPVEISFRRSDKMKRT